jgi:hypothetical protein
MTKQQFLSGVEFEINGNFFKFEFNRITKVYRSSDRSKVILEDYHMNVEKVGKVQFECFTFLLGKKIVRKIRFEDLEVFKS